MFYSKKLTLIFIVMVSLCQTSLAQNKIIAFAQDEMKNDFRRHQVFEARNEAEKHSDITFIYSDADGKTSLLIRQIEQFIRQKVDLIILGTNDESAVVPVISKAYKKGIPVIILDRGINGSDYTTFINSDNVAIGTMGAEYIAKKLNYSGSVLLFEGLQKADVTHLRTQGFMAVMDQHKNIKVIKRTGNYLRKDALIEMEKMVKAGIHVDAIFSESDSMLSGVRVVLKKYGIDATKIISVGCDFTSEAQQAIRDKTQTASILFPLGGTKAIQTALDIFKKKIIEKHIINPVKLVTENNVEKVTPIF